MVFLVLLLASAPIPPAIDTTSYVVLNHGRPAGEMLVIAAADTVVVKYHHVDRNRGPRSETHYVLSRGRVVAGRTWNLPLYGNPATLGAPADRFEVTRDSLFWGRDSTRGAPLTPRTFYRLGFTPYAQTLLARFLLGQPDHSAQLLPRGTAHLEVVGDTVVRTRLGRQRVRLAMMRDTVGEANGVWLDDRNQLFADQVGWFITVQRGAEQALPALRAIEIALTASARRPER